MYDMPKANWLHRLNEGRSRPPTDRDVFAETVKLSILKKIDGFIKKGLAYYVDPSNPVQSKEESIFFRKIRFNASLNLGAKQVVNQFEEEKLSFSALAKLSDFNLKRQLPVFKVSDAPHTASAAVREALYPTKPLADDKKFLERLITGFAENNILVFEFVEHHSLLEKPNINCFYLAPNVIVLKRQKSFKREIFTLAHELGHFLLNKEEIDEKANGEERGDTSLNTIEKWWNEFADCFLAAQVDDEIFLIQNSDGFQKRKLIEFIISSLYATVLKFALLSGYITDTEYCQKVYLSSKKFQD